ncbi:sigma 54-interacting transcriptional regulator [Actimicrobium sp. CCI2.3]|uniref:sigma 54-interacting transcriptional regulator n=1 Tax=Actimicrobium sp. CCI2.3 TaxID=3048616 RepID=UPI002AB3640F|nr:sigma 54-interacting transcriptional regulator [Actimicrobium sp. CCI2.3]MDY7575308.1 sigma 54-interacting transcriptional regulator [Actimicrobium sp. CCI2.3]MEB0023103.1 sigma 54-interacting transcriptional regulator [Actimicrobium sp. CCI2.3]
MALFHPSLLLCIEPAPLLERVLRVAQAMAVRLKQIPITEVAQEIALRPAVRILVCQNDTQFDKVIEQCGRIGASTQQKLVRLVDGNDYATCVATASVCKAISIPATDSRLREVLQQLLEFSAIAGDELPHPDEIAPAPHHHSNNTLPPQPAGSASGAPVIADINHEIYATARRIAATDVDIVLVGETGTGKDWLAHYIHDYSGSQGPFVAVNCPAIPETLAEAELFGVDAGAYTGATKSRPGRIESANGGTLYLDEIDSMALTLQAKLLRVLQDRGVERVGSTAFRQLSFRVIVSTKVPLAKLVEEGKFRTDLYYRLSVVELALPVLRSQPARALDLFWRYVDHAARQFKLPPGANVNPCIEAQILSHGWDGNIRELRAAAQRYALGFPAIGGDTEKQHGGSLKDLMHQFERTLLVATLERCKRNVARAAKELGVEPHVLYYKLKTLDIHNVGRGELDSHTAEPRLGLLGIESDTTQGKKGKREAR